MLSIQPTELKAEVTLGKEIKFDLFLENTSDSMVAFKVRTSQQHGYLIKPREDVIPPGDTFTCKIIVKPMQQYPDPSDKILKPRFQVLSVKTDKVPTSWATFWKQTAKDQKDVRIKCKLSIPEPSGTAPIAVTESKEGESTAPVEQETTITTMIKQKAEIAAAEKTEMQLKSPMNASRAGQITTPGAPRVVPFTIEESKEESTPTLPVIQETEVEKVESAPTTETPIVEVSPEIPVSKPVQQQSRAPIVKTTPPVPAKPASVPVSAERKTMVEESSAAAVIVPEQKKEKITEITSIIVEGKKQKQDESNNDMVPKEWFEKASAHAAQLEKNSVESKQELAKLRKSMKKMEMERDSLLSEVNALTRKVTHLHQSVNEEGEAKSTEETMRKRNKSKDWAADDIVVGEEYNESFEEHESAGGQIGKKAMQFQPWQIAVLAVLCIIIGRMMS